jgi:hypothetical protein
LNSSERLSRSGRYNLKPKSAMLLLIADDAPLGAEWLDHPLKGGRVDHRECHLGGDMPGRRISPVSFPRKPESSAVPNTRANPAAVRSGYRSTLNFDSDIPRRVGWRGAG